MQCEHAVNIPSLSATPPLLVPTEWKGKNSVRSSRGANASSIERSMLTSLDAKRKGYLIGILSKKIWQVTVLCVRNRALDGGTNQVFARSCGLRLVGLARGTYGDTSSLLGA